MNQALQQLYYLLPPPLRSVATSLRGYHLRWWRYGSAMERLVEDVFKRENWTEEQWSAWRADRMAYLLHRAATRVPYYRSQWESRRRQGDQTSWERLENWPILEKEQVRQAPKSFLADDRSPRKLWPLHTSGTTGTPLRLWQSRATLQSWYALFEARWRRWHGVSIRDRWAILGGQMVTPYKQKRPPFWVWNAAFNQLYMSAHHLAPDLIPHYLDALRKYRITYLLGYTSALHALAQEAIRLGRDDLQMKVVITEAEPIFFHQRSMIRQAFQCPVRETYGTSEKVAAAGECEAGRLHLWPEAGFVETLDGDRPVGSGVPGELVITGLLNDDMPLIRYRVGDIGILAPPRTTCSCGRSLPILESIEGRTDDLLYTPEGRCIGRLDPVFKADMPIREAQIVQEALDCVRVLYVPAAGFTETHEKTIVEHVQARMGKVQVVLEAVSQVPRTANGKFRAVICKIAPPARQKGNMSEALIEPESS